ncbi:hypothetical protein V1506DRAFT_27428 [Lipomyces tetrasporus]
MYNKESYLRPSTRNGEGGLAELPPPLNSSQTLDILGSIRQAEILLLNPSSNKWATNPRLTRLDQNALQARAIKVPALLELACDRCLR